MTGATGRRRVVVTGASGLIGTVVCNDLETDHDVIGLDRRPRRRGVRRVDTTNRRRTLMSFAGADAVVDLASIPNASASWADVLENNLLAAATCFDVAAELGIRRVVYASSNHATGLYERREPFASVLTGRYDGLDPATLPRISSSWALRPDGPYAVGKIAAEMAGKVVAETRGVSVICLRIGHVSRADEPRSARDYATYLSHRDLAQLVRCALDAPDRVQYAVVYGVSANTWRIWDLEEPRNVLGYNPLDNAEAMRSSETDVDRELAG